MRILFTKTVQNLPRFVYSINVLFDDITTTKTNHLKSGLNVEKRQDNDGKKSRHGMPSIVRKVCEFHWDHKRRSGGWGGGDEKRGKSGNFIWETHMVKNNNNTNEANQLCVGGGVNDESVDKDYQCKKERFRSNRNHIKKEIERGTYSNNLSIYHHLQNT